VANAIGLFRKRNQAVQIDLVSAMPAELERRLLQDQLHLAIGYFSGQQSALDYHPLFSEQQQLYCAKSHPLFGVAQVSQAQLDACDGVRYPYRFVHATEPYLPNHSTGRTEQVEGSLAFILSGAHIGYLPQHIAAPWEARGLLRALKPQRLGFNVQFHLTCHRGRQPSEAQQALVEDLMQAFSDSAHN
jgi:DNA-binding transcriptional LysR family regulator